MVAYSFQPRFVNSILVGIGLAAHVHTMATLPRPKRQTIRARGLKRHALPGEIVQLYCQQRHPEGFKIGEARCVRVSSITLKFGKSCSIRLHHRAVPDMPGLGLDGFARRDGFESWEDMRRFWREHHGEIAEFSGLLIEWEPLP